MNIEGSASPYQRDMQEIARLQQIFDQTLGLDSRRVRLNYNPVLARWKYERLLQKGAPEQEIARFKRYETFQIETTLRERNHAAKSSVNYLVDSQGEVWNERFPDEPFRMVLERGLIYQKEHNSQELEREQAEYNGWNRACDLLKNPDTPIGTKAIFISGPGIVEGTNYVDNFVDIYEAMEGVEKGRFIRMVRHATDLSYDSYSQIAIHLNPDFFNAFTGPIDAWFLEHFIKRDPRFDPRLADQIIDQEFGRREGAMYEDTFQRVLRPCLPRTSYFIDVLCQKFFDPRELALAWNAILEMNDRGRKSLEQGGRVSLQEDIWINPSRSFNSIREEVAWYGRARIAEIAAACGLSSGFKIPGGLPTWNQMVDSLGLSNSVGKFGLERFSPNLKFNGFACPDKECGYRTTSAVGSKCPGCGLTKEEFKNCGGQVCE